MRADLNKVPNHKTISKRTNKLKEYGTQWINYRPGLLRM